jgi:hypothetical protein
MFKKSILFTFLTCILFTLKVSLVNADPYPVPNNYLNSVSASANTSGLKQLIDCSKPGMKTVSAIVSASAPATVNFNVIGANQDGTPNLGFSMTFATMLSATSGTSAPLNIPVGAFSFFQINSATTGVALNYIAGCR